MENPYCEFIVPEKKWIYLHCYSFKSAPYGLKIHDSSYNSHLHSVFQEELILTFCYSLEDCSNALHLYRRKYNRKYIS